MNENFFPVFIPHQPFNSDSHFYLRYLPQYATRYVKFCIFHFASDTQHKQGIVLCY
jgi:hypothetical protein